MFGEKKKIMAGLKIREMRIDGLTKKAFDFVSINSSFSNFGGDNKAKAGRKVRR